MNIQDQPRNELKTPQKAPAKSQVAALPVLAKRPRPDNEFLPAALEILETPLSPVRTVFLYFICILVTCTLLWSWLGTFDIVSVAQGKVQPTGRVKIVQSLEMGKTRSVPVSNGMKVKAGQTLVELDDTEIRAEENGAAASLQAYRAEVVRRRAVLSVIAEWQERGIWTVAHRIPGQAPVFPGDVPAEIRLREQVVYGADISQLGSALDNLDAQRRQRQAEIDSLASAIAAQRTLVATLTERVTMRSELIASEAGSRAQVIDALQQQQEATTNLASQVGQLHAARAALDVATSEGAKLAASLAADNAQKLSEASRRADELEQQRIKARERRLSMTISSPTGGTVQMSAITTIGQVVTAGSELMRIVPDNASLEIEAYLPNRDVGFVVAGQPAIIKVEAYPFTRFGIIEGRVTRVATDAIPEPDAQQVEAAAAKQLQSTIPTGNVQRMQNLVFPVTVAPDKHTIRVEGRDMPLTPGMAVTIEVKTGKRRILEYLFSPLAEIASQAMGER
ncbi:MAG: HlyD family type I secretion periplasmic adaptor subunit [Phyllobacterium sp.]